MSDLQPPRISRIILPPMWVGILLGVEYALDVFVPVHRWLFAPWNFLGFLVVGLGAALMLWAVYLFRKGKTGLVPFSDATTLVQHGPYRFTRNPMYVGMFLMLLGAATWLGSITPLGAPGLFVVIITRLFILPEEAQMERTFGDSYRSLQKSVRRWL